MRDIRDLMIYALDNELTESEQAELDAALLDSPELRLERREYLKMRTMLSDLSLEEQPGFEEEIIQKWKAKGLESKFTQSVIRLFPRVAAAAIILFGFSWITLHLWGENLTLETLTLLGEISSEEAEKLWELIEH